VEKIGKHISELLFDHDCVIVPSLGGFLASNQSSRVLLPNHIIFPPYRRIAFNVYLKQNDGLLANHLVKTENIPYSEATQLIDSFTTECFENLDNGKKVNITEVGTLYFDKERNIQFEAFRKFNHLKESFGMEPVHFLPVSRDQKQESKRLPAEKTIRASLPSPVDVRNKVVSANKNKRYLGVAIIGAALVWVALNIYLVAPKKYESTSLSPFDSQSTAITKTDSIRNIPAEVQKTDSEIAIENTITTTAPSETTASVEEKTETIAPAIIAPPNTTVVTFPPATTPGEEIETSGRTKKHYLVAGVFKIKENADGMLLRLRQSGFSNARIVEANDRHYVSYSSFSKVTDAVSLADSLRGKNLEGWVWYH